GTEAGTNARARRGVEGDCAVDVPHDFDPRGGRVDVLPARAAGPSGSHDQLPAGYRQSVGNRQISHGQGLPTRAPCDRPPSAASARVRRQPSHRDGGGWRLGADLAPSPDAMHAQCSDAPAVDGYDLELAARESDAIADPRHAPQFTKG